MTQTVGSITKTDDTGVPVVGTDILDKTAGADDPLPTDPLCCDVRVDPNVAGGTTGIGIIVVWKALKGPLL